VQFCDNIRHFSSSSVLGKNIRNNNINTSVHDLLSNMPKEEVHLKDIRKMRMEKRTKRFLVQPTNIYRQVLFIILKLQILQI
jgi:hypothetical protein